MTKYTTAYSWTGHVWLILATRDCKNKYINDILTTMKGLKSTALTDLHLMGL